MPENHGLPAEFMKLLEAACDGTLPAERIGELEHYLAESDAAQQLLIDYFRLDAELSVHCQNRRALKAVDAIAEDQLHAQGRARQYAGAPMQHIARLMRRPSSVAITVAALVIGLLITAMALVAPPFLSPFSRPHDSQPQYVARLTGMHDAVWAEGQIGVHRGAHLLTGHLLRLEKGLAEVAYLEGVRVVLEGPCEYVIDGSQSGKIRAGRLTAHIGPQAKSFRLQTPNSTIVDLGTEFGTSVDSQHGTHVHVFRGLVEVGWGERHEQYHRQLRAGESLQIGPSGAVDRVVGSDISSAFARSLPEDLLPPPLLHWTFDNVHDGVAPDASGHGRHGRLEASMNPTNVTAGPRDFGKALNFDGKRQKVVLPGEANGPLNRSFTAFTFSFWFRPELESNGVMIGKMGADGGWQLKYGGQFISLVSKGDGRGGEGCQFASPLNNSARPDEFTHVAVAFSANKSIRVYVNGEQMPDSAAPAGWNSATRAEFCVGHRGDGSAGDFFLGAIDDVRVYDAALSSRQIQKIYHNEF